MATSNKSCLKFQPSDWFTNSYAVSNDSTKKIDSSHNTRQEGRALRLRADLSTKWDELNNTTRLAKRIDSIKNWKEVFEEAKEMLEVEMKKLDVANTTLSKEMQALHIPSSCLTECLTLRDMRRNINFVEDEPEINQTKEKRLIEHHRTELQKCLDASFDQMNLLKEVYHQVLIELQNKNEAMDVDIEQYKLNQSSAGVSFKVDPTRIPKGSITPQQWEEFAQYVWNRVLSEIDSSAQLRGDIQNSLCKSVNDQHAQSQATEFAIRRRIHDMKQAIDELEWQEKQTEDEISNMEHDLDKMEEMIGATIPAQKLAETRLERRTYRPIGELCCDAAQHGLINEKNQIETTRGALLEKQAQMRHALNDLYKQLKHIKDDLRDKYSSLQLETRCLDLRGCHMHEEGLKEGDNEAEAIPSNFHEPGDAETTTSSGIGDRISALTNFSAIRL